MNQSRQSPIRFPGSRRTSALVLVAILALLLAACSRPPQPAATPTPRPAAAPAVQQTPPQALPAPGTAAVPAATKAAALPATPAAQAADGEPPLTGQANRIVIPKIDLDAPIIDVGWKVIERGGERFTEWETAADAAGRHVNSARPGEQGNVVLSGHHNTKGEVFRRISDLELAVGDTIYLYDGQGQRFAYVVDEVTDPPLPEVGASEEERLANASYIQPTSDARVTLVTCWPYWTNTHRVIIVGKLAQ